eukprot:2480526-Ditylum_brightwellii.AAC.1
MPAFQMVYTYQGLSFGGYATPHIIPASPFLKIYALAPSNMMIHPAWVVQHIIDDNGKKQTIDDLFKGPPKQT